MSILVIGGSGYLGREIVRQSTAAGHRVTATLLTRPPEADDAQWLPLDVRDRRHVGKVMAAVRPASVINAAYRQDDWTTTADGAAHVALAAAKAGARLVHVSSDAVFSGHAARYDETAVPDPTTPYGAAKAAAETAVRAISPDSVIARNSLILGDGASVHEHRVHELAARATGASSSTRWSPAPPPPT